MITIKNIFGLKAEMNSSCIDDQTIRLTVKNMSTKPFPKSMLDAVRYKYKAAESLDVKNAGKKQIRIGPRKIELCLGIDECAVWQDFIEHAAWFSDYRLVCTCSVASGHRYDIAVKEYDGVADIFIRSEDGTNIPKIAGQALSVLHDEYVAVSNAMVGGRQCYGIVDYERAFFEVQFKHRDIWLSLVWCILSIV